MAQSEWSPQYWKAQFKIGIQNYHTNNQAHSIILTLKIITTIFTARQTELYVNLGLAVILTTHNKSASLGTFFGRVLNCVIRSGSVKARTPATTYLKTQL